MSDLSGDPVDENDASSSHVGGDEISQEEREQRREALEELVSVMSEAVREDGGELVLVDADYQKGVVEVELQGACGSCAISSITLQGGVERMLKERLAWVTEVRGGVDESIDFDSSFAMGRGAYIPRA
jgi:Fe-S cluster biogenesis protein NfuA